MIRIFNAACFRLLLPSVIACALSVSASSQVSVPGDFDTPQEAVEGSPAGSTIIIAGGTWGPLLIDKEVTIIGEPRATFEASVGPRFPYLGMDPAIYLDGPGFGSVTLVNVQTSTSFDGFRGFAVGQVTSGIMGSNFSSLHIYGSTILGVEWDRATLTGSAQGVAAINLMLNRGLTPSLLIQDSFLRGSRSSNDFSEGGGPSSSGEGIRSDGDVVLVNSTLVGGTYDDAVAFFPLTSCPTAPGGLAVRANNLFEYSSLLQSGTPGFFSDAAGASCTAASGPVVAANRHVVSSSNLARASEPRVGQDFTLIWTLPNSTETGLIFMSAGFSSPLSGSFGTLFLDPARLIQTLPASTSAGIQVLAVPNDSALIGFEVGFQLFTLGGIGLGNPLGAVVRP